MLRAMQFEEDAGPLAHPVRPDAYREINNFYTLTVYEKGAEVIRMLETLIGRDAFDRGMQLYFDRMDGTAATVEDFIACFEETSGQSLDQFMRWYTQSGTPVVAAEGRHDATARTYTLTLSQSCPPTPGQPNKDPFVIPVKLGLVSDDGDDLALTSDSDALHHGDVIVLDRDSLSVTFSGIDAAPLPSLPRGFSAPVKLVSNTDTGDYRRAARLDRDPFNRWEAMQRLMLAELTVSGGPSETGIDAIAEALAATLGDATLDPAFKAEMLRPPSESDIAQAIGSDIDPDAVHAAAQALKAGIGQRIETALSDGYQAQAIDGPYAPTADAAGQRSLRAACLALLVAGAPARGGDMALAQFDQADNMTERFSALTLLVHHTDHGADAAARFYDRFSDNALVVDKWLAVQATKPGAATLDAVRELTGHPAFTYANPNRVRSLIGAFAMRNPTGFHRADGTGYGFIAETVLRLDAKNPQVAARLLTAFGSWRSLEAGRRDKAHEALSTIRRMTPLSSDVADIIGRMTDD